MAAAWGALGLVVPHCLSGYDTRRCLVAATKMSFRCAAIRIVPAAGTTSTASTTTDSFDAEFTKEDKVDRVSPKLACPICYCPFTSTSLRSVRSPSRSDLECPVCKKVYTNNEVFIDLTVTGESTDYAESMPAATELFRTPLVSFLYERGWRQNFVLGGFPGPEREFEMAKKYLKSTAGGTLVDASCGSGLFSRMFANSKGYSLVVALDFSENMLRQCKEFIISENVSDENLILVRADISRLPFGTGSIDAVHAGAALHCWPSPSSAVAEISRVLRPGGVFVATTFILDSIPPVLPFMRIAHEVLRRTSSNTLFLSEGELRDLCQVCGLIGFTCIRNGSFVMISATKPT